jgi:hypothetical protein
MKLMGDHQCGYFQIPDTNPPQTDYCVVDVEMHPRQALRLIAPESHELVIRDATAEEHENARNAGWDGVALVVAVEQKVRGWRPMETAPKDETVIFVKHSDGVVSRAMYSRSRDAWMPPYGTECGDVEFNATEWKPISPPAH